MASLFETAALRVEQPIGEYWVAAVPASILLRVTSPDLLRVIVDPAYRPDADEWKTALRLLGTQRELEARRIGEIGEYIDTRDATFPNAIILAANSESSTDDESDARDWEIRNGRLIIPENAKRAMVVDGQHRLYGFLRSHVARENFTLVCSVFFGMPQQLQASLFATINTNQKAVRRGLALNLYGYNVEDEDRHQWSPEKLAVFVTRRLHWDENSALQDRIKLEAAGAAAPEILPGATRAISLAAVVDGVLGLITSDAKGDRTALRSERFFKTRRRELEADNAPMRAWYLKSSDHELYSVIRDFVGVVDTRFWAKGNPGSMLTRAVGVRALFAFFGERMRRLDLHPAVDGRENPQTIARVHSDLNAAFATTSRIDFSDPFFEATGRGQRRIFNAMRLVTGMIELSDVPAADATEYERVDAIP